MAFAMSGLDPSGSAGSKGTKTLGVYQSTDAQATIDAGNYFNSAVEELARCGALIIFSSDKTYLAKVSISGTTVTLAALDAYA
jgi:hypothetical protein